MKYMKLGSKPDAFQADGNNIRFVATELATDITVNIGDVKFYLHKFPLLSKCFRLQKLVTTSNEETIDEIDISDIPGGPLAFEICAKFCYGMTVTLNAYNVVPARCAAEYLEMHENIEKGNLIYKIEVFLSSSIFCSWKDTIIVLQTTKSLLPWSEDLKVVSHCIESVSSKAFIDSSEVDWSYTYNRKKLTSENGLDQHWNGVRKQQLVPKDWWVEDLSELEMDLYKRVLMAIKGKGRSSSQVMGEALKAYTYRRLPGFAKGTMSYGGDILKHRTLTETIVWLLPVEVGSVSCNFLLKLLKGAILLESGEMCKKELIRRIGFQLEGASACDLLIPASTAQNTVYDVNIVLSIVEEFVMQEHGSTRASPQSTEDVQEVRSPNPVSSCAKIAVAKLIDAYLSEIAKDSNLPLSQFIELAEMASGSSRPVHDGLYRAIDMYLKVSFYFPKNKSLNPRSTLFKSEKKKICGLMDRKKLSADACTHAVQNERLPLRVVVQVLFFEQLRASAPAVAVTNSGADPLGSARSLLPRENGGSYGSSRSAVTTNTEDDWDGVPTTRDASSFKSRNLEGRGGDSKRSSGCSDTNKNVEDKVNSKVKGNMMPKKLLSKLWSSKGQTRENNSSDTSESHSSINQDESKSTPSRKIRHLVS